LHFFKPSGERYLNIDFEQWGNDPAFVMGMIWATIFANAKTVGLGLETRVIIPWALTSEETDQSNPGVAPNGNKITSGTSIPTSSLGFSAESIQNSVIPSAELCRSPLGTTDGDLIAAYVRGGMSLDFSLHSYAETIKALFQIKQDKLAKMMIQHAGSIQRLHMVHRIDDITINFN
jgi:hypothetical protein